MPQLFAASLLQSTCIVRDEKFKDRIRYARTAYSVLSFLMLFYSGQSKQLRNAKYACRKVKYFFMILLEIVKSSTNHTYIIVIK